MVSTHWISLLNKQKVQNKSEIELIFHKAIFDKLSSWYALENA